METFRMVGLADTSNRCVPRRVRSARGFLRVAHSGNSLIDLRCAPNKLNEQKKQTKPATVIGVERQCASTRDRCHVRAVG